MSINLKKIKEKCITYEDRWLILKKDMFPMLQLEMEKAAKNNK
jgi:hypothetical protein